MNPRRSPVSSRAFVAVVLALSLASVVVSRWGDVFLWRTLTRNVTPRDRSIELLTPR
jgi:hypothetical protein